MSQHLDMTMPQIADFLAATAVAAAESYLSGRSDVATLARQADELARELMQISGEPDCNAIADPTRMLVSSMMRISVSTGRRAMYWRAITSAVVDLVRLESLTLPRPWARCAPAPGNAAVLAGARAE